MCGVDNLDLYRAIVRDPVTGQEWRDYWAFNVLGLVAAAVETPALGIDESRTMGLFLFRLVEAPSLIVVDERVVDAVLRRAIPGVVFDAGERVVATRCPNPGESTATSFLDKKEADHQHQSPDDHLHHRSPGPARASGTAGMIRPPPAGEQKWIADLKPEYRQGENGDKAQPISHSWGERIGVRVELKVEPPDADLESGTLIGESGRAELSFVSGELRLHGRPDDGDGAGQCRSAREDRSHRR